MEVTQQGLEFIQRALLYGSNKLKPGSAKSDSLPGSCSLSKIDWSKIGRMYLVQKVGGRGRWIRTFTIVYTNESESEIDYIKSKYVLVSIY